MPVCAKCDGSGAFCYVCGDTIAGCQCTSADIEDYEREYGESQFDPCPWCSVKD